MHAFVEPFMELGLYSFLAEGIAQAVELQPVWIERIPSVRETPGMAYVHLITDVVIGVCYLIVPLIMLVFARRKKDVPFPKVFGLFAASLLFCGATQFIDVLVAQWDWPRLDTLLRIVAAAIAIITVCVLINILPQAVELKGPKEFQSEIENRTHELVMLTGQLQSEVVRREAMVQDLKENRGLLRLAMATNNTGFFSWDVPTNTLTLDAAAAELAGLPEGQTAISFDSYMANIRADYHPVIEEALKSFTEELDELEVRYPYRRGTGSEIWIAGRGKSIFDAEGNLTKIIGLQQDVTEQVAREKELDQQAEAARKANELKTKFIAQISHEIRTPLAVMLGGLDTLLMSSEPENGREVLSLVRSQGELLQVLVNDVLDLSKIEMGKIHYDVKPTLVANVISDVWSLMGPLAHEKGVAIEWVAETKLPEKITCDHLRLKQVLVNLIGNAIKFTEHAAVTIVCKVDSHEAKQHFLVVEVRDSDIEILDAKRDEVVGEFDRVDQFRSGYGLGLVICKRLVEIMGGYISAKSREGAGTSFVVRIPIGRISEEDLFELNPISINIKRIAKSKEALKQLPLKVLAAEDTRAIQFILRKMIGSMVTDFEIAANGRIACEEVMRAEGSEQPFDLILMDVQMPELDGIEATRKLRTEGFRKPIIALTAGAMESEKQACIEAGCNHFLAKPIDLRELRRLMQKICLEKV